MGFSDATRLFLTDSSCKWAWTRNTWGLPNVDWCEKNGCGWVSEPANTWSNVAYFVVSYLILRHAQGRTDGGALRFRRQSNQVAYLIAPACAMMGFLSLVYHASVTRLLQVMDFVGMFAYICHLLVFNVVRLGWLRGCERAAYYSAIVFFTLVVFAVQFAGLPIQPIVMVQIVIMLLTEFMCFVMASPQEREKADKKHLYQTLALLAIAAAFSAADHKRVLCWEDHPFIQGHAIWHVFSAASVYTAYLYYLQFDQAKY